MAEYPHLPDPEAAAEHPEASWRLSSGERVWAAPGVVCVGQSERRLGDVEGDALALLEAVAWARQSAEDELRRDHPTYCRWSG